MPNDPKDRHVLAAAVKGDAAVIVTANLRDFPATALRPYDITAIHPDDFLLNQLDLYPQIAVQCVREQIADYCKPTVTMADLLSVLDETVPRFAAAIGPLLAGSAGF